MTTPIEIELVFCACGCGEALVKSIHVDGVLIDDENITVTRKYGYVRTNEAGKRKIVVDED